MRLFATATAVAAIIATGTTGFVPPVSAQQYVYPRPMPRSFQGGADNLRDLVDEAPGFAAGQYQPAANGFGDEMRLSEAALDDLVAPVALYPDNLLAQILVAATHPLDVVQADRLLLDSEGLSDDEMSVLLAEQDWDPSVMVLMSGFPEVIQMMAEDLDWTEELGDAMLAQDADVLAAVQRRRTQAYNAGNLVSNQAQQIERQDEQIYIRPTDPDQVYVPYYDSAQVYSTRTAPPPAVSGSQNPLANPIVAGALAFGSAFLVSSLFDGGDDDDDDDDWGDYWDRRDRAIDWRGRQVYARPYHAYGWRDERDRYWDRDGGRWRREAERDRRHMEARRDAIRWLEEDNERRDERLDALRERERDARRAARRLDDREWVDRERAERREERLRKERQAERREERLKEESREDRRGEREREARREEREQRREEQARQEQREQRLKEERREEQRAQEKAEKRKAEKAREAEQQKSSRATSDDRQKAMDNRADDNRKSGDGGKKSESKKSESKKSESKKSEGKKSESKKSGGKNENKKACRDGNEKACK